LRQPTVSPSRKGHRQRETEDAQLGHGALADLGLGEVVDVGQLEERVALELEHELALELDVCGDGSGKVRYQ